MSSSESRPPAPGPALSASQEDAASDGFWVGSFLLAQPGKTYRGKPAADGHRDAAHEGAIEAARTLTDAVERAAGTGGAMDEAAPG